MLRDREGDKDSERRRERNAKTMEINVKWYLKYIGSSFTIKTEKEEEEEFQL